MWHVHNLLKKGTVKKKHKKVSDMYITCKEKRKNKTRKKQKQKSKRVRVVSCKNSENFSFRGEKIN